MLFHFSKLVKKSGGSCHKHNVMNFVFRVSPDTQDLVGPKLNSAAYVVEIVKNMYHKYMQEYVR